MKPTVKITTNKNEVKHYSDKVYLKNSASFEIMIFNPLQETVLAKIEMDGQLISESGLIVYPGQRIFLERFLDTPKKFKFSTYEVEDSKEAKKAISKNGLVKVLFYKEKKAQLPIMKLNEIYYPPFPNPSYPTWTNGPLLGNYARTSVDPSFQSFYSSTIGTTSDADYTSSDNLKNLRGSDFASEDAVQMSVNSIETGRVEKGTKSDQKFEYEDREFEYFAFSTETIQILPESQKPVDISKVRAYCPGCGARQKQSSWKFCPYCSTSLTD